MQRENRKITYNQIDILRTQRENTKQFFLAA